MVNINFLKIFATRLMKSIFLLLVANDAHPLQNEYALKQVTELPLALQQLPAATGVCRRDDAIALADPLGLPAQFAKLDLGCGRTAKDALTLIANPNSVLIDVRTATEYQNFHANQAINMSRSEISAKAYLKNKDIILMGNGKMESEVYRTCTLLTQMGYPRVFVIQGGVTSWMLNGYATLGNLTAAFDNVRLSAAELLIESRESENLIYLDATRDDMRAFFPSASTLKDASAEAISASVKALKSKELLGIVLIGARTLTIEQIRLLQQAALPLRLVVYNGLATDYRKFLDQQKKTLVAQANGPKKLGCGL
jgi:rhodanese-related sulfurtransferase